MASSAATAPSRNPADGEKSEEKKPVPFQIRSPKRIDRIIKMLVYGTYGVGKTTFAASAQDVPAMQDVLYIDAEAGDMSLEEREDLSVISVKDFNQFARIYEYLRLHCNFRDEKDTASLIKSESYFRGEDVEVPHIYRTVVIDSITEVQKMLMYKLLNIKPGITKLDDTLETPEFKEWGQSAESIRLLIRAFRDLPMHVIFVCSEQIIEDEQKQQHRRPNLPGKLSLEAMAFMDIVGLLGMAKDTSTPPKQIRRLYIQPGQTYQAKSRFTGSDTRWIDNPTMVTLLQHSKTFGGSS